MDNSVVLRGEGIRGLSGNGKRYNKDYILKKLNVKKRILIIHNIFSYISGIKLEVNIRKRSVKSLTIWKQNSTLLNNSKVKGEIERVIRVYKEMKMKS